MKPLLYWLPRVSGLLVAAFISIFAADAFSEGHGFWLTLAALAMHLIPTAVVLLAVAIAWRWEAAGGLLFILAGAYHTTWAMSRGFRVGDLLLISGPVYAVGALFVIDWFYRRRLTRG